MLFVQNNFINKSLQFRDAEPGEIAGNADEVKLNFEDKSLICSKQQLTNLAALKVLLNPKLGISDGKEVNLPNCHSEVFKTVSLLVLEKGHVFEALPPEKIGPFIYEDLCDDVEIFHPSNKEVCTAISKQLESLTYEESTKIVKEYEEAKQANSPKISDKIPSAVLIARKVLQATAFFANNQEASIHFEKIRHFELERFFCKQALEKLRGDIGLNNTANGLIENQISIFHSDLIECEQQIKTLRSMVDPASLKMLQRQNIVARAEDVAIENREMVNQFKKDLEAYRKEVVDCLKSNGAADRPDLMEYLVGPKAYLFDYYGLKPCITYNPRFPFRHNEVYHANFGYRLENPSAKDLEDEIRTDLKKYLHILPEPIVKERVISKPLSSEVQKLREKILPMLKKWKDCTEEEKSQVKQTLIAYNGWDRFLIPTSNLVITIEKEVTETTDIDALLIFNGRTIAMMFNPVDFHLLHLMNGKPVPEQSLTTGMLEELYSFASITRG